jgi:hypothetical protein
VMLKLLIVLSSVVLSFSSVAFAASEHYECNSLAMCAPDARAPGSVNDYYGSGSGPDRSSAAAAAQADVLNTCEQDCTRKSGMDCHGIRVYNCELVKE